jgi:hypothetical protein
MTDQTKNSFAVIVLIAALASACTPPALADSISPSINDAGKVYSTEKADSSYFGTGAASRLSEASHLRFKGDRLITEGEIDEGIKVLAKAVQFDPDDPSGHLMLARAMTQKLRANRTKGIDWELFGQCLDEWNLIAKHDADHTEQLEARNVISSLKKMAKEQVLKTQGKKPKRSLLAGLNPLNRFK